MVTCDFSKECEIAVSTSQYTASAHKARYAVFQVANNCYPEAQKALRNLLSNRIKRGTTVKTSIKEQNGSAKLKQAMFLSNNCQLKFSRRRKETRAASILTSFRIVIKVEWCTETLSFHTVIWKVSKKHIDVICLTHFPQSKKT